MPTKTQKQSVWTKESERLREVFAASGLSKASLARAAHVDPATLADMLEGKRAPRDQSLLAVCEVLRANPSWIKMQRPPQYLADNELAVAVAAPKTRSATDLQPVQLPGIERYLSETRGVTPDEREWLRTVPFPSSHIRYPDMVYSILLHTYRQMRDYKPFDDAHTAEP